MSKKQSDPFGSRNWQEWRHWRGCVMQKYGRFFWNNFYSSKNRRASGWLHELDKTEVDGQSLASHLTIFDNLSFWWLTSVAEKSPFLCESIFQVFKLRTLEKIYADKHCQGLIYHGSSEPLHSTLKAWSQDLGHHYKWVPSSVESSARSNDRFGRKIILKLHHLLLWK